MSLVSTILPTHQSFADVRIIEGICSAFKTVAEYWWILQFCCLNPLWPIVSWVKSPIRKEPWSLIDILDVQCFTKQLNLHMSCPAGPLQVCQLRFWLGSEWCPSQRDVWAGEVKRWDSNNDFMQAIFLGFASDDCWFPNWTSTVRFFYRADVCWCDKLFGAQQIRALALFSGNIYIYNIDIICIIYIYVYIYIL
jgi:hypothetical protein